jgi:hypothetical protein
MIQGKIIPFPLKNPFSAEAEKRWNKIDKSIQKEISKNVWCSYCSSASTILLESAKMEHNDLILNGNCKVCGNEICRVV